MRMLIAVLIGGIGVALIIAGSRGAAASVLGTLTADTTAPGKAAGAAVAAGARGVNLPTPSTRNPRITVR